MSGKPIAVLATIAVVLAVGAGLYLAGPPGEERLLRLDEQRVQHLQQLARAVDDYWRANQALPHTLAELRDERRLTMVPTDPVTGADYEYEPLDRGRYRLCARFDRPAREPYRNGFWTHEAGPRCFELAATAARG